MDVLPIHVKEMEVCKRDGDFSMMSIDKDAILNSPKSYGSDFLASGDDSP